jgi:hypothetical protein
MIQRQIVCAAMTENHNEAISKAENSNFSSALRMSDALQKVGKNCLVNFALFTNSCFLGHPHDKHGVEIMSDEFQWSDIFNDPHFKTTVGAIANAVGRLHQIRPDIDPIYFNSALLYMNAALYESSPYYDSKEKLDDALKLTCAESTCIFEYLRSERNAGRLSLLERQGKPSNMN